MGNKGYTLRAAIAHLSRHGCDLTDPLITDRIRADDASFHLGYLEEFCGRRLTVDEVLRVAHPMTRAHRRERHAASQPSPYMHPAARFGLN
jgi:hypothetical protein